MIKLRKYIKPTIMASFAWVLTLATPALALSEKYVTPNKTHGWTDSMSVAGGRVVYAKGAPVGMGSGSIELQTDNNPLSKATYYKELDPTPLKQLTTARYWTKQLSASSPAGSAGFNLGVDINGDGQWDTNLVYEPYWQNGENPDADPVQANTWQEWDVTGGLFWSSRAVTSSVDELDFSLTPGAGGPPFTNLEAFNEAFPDAQLLGVSVGVGSNNLNYLVQVDGVQLNDVLYNFGYNQPGVSQKDQCKNNGWENLTDSDGNVFTNQGRCVSYFAKNRV